MKDYDIWIYEAAFILCVAGVLLILMTGCTSTANASALTSFINSNERYISNTQSFALTHVPGHVRRLDSQLATAEELLLRNGIYASALNSRIYMARLRIDRGLPITTDEVNAILRAVEKEIN